MRFLRYTVLPVVLATAWIGAIEFLRNQLLFLQIWQEHYAGMGLVFPIALVNGAVWGIWSLVFAAAIYMITRRFGLIGSSVLAWVVGFVLMWLVVGNMGVLPFRLLWFAVPMSMLEAFGAVFICDRLGGMAFR